jgi:hypothetical protein
LSLSVQQHGMGDMSGSESLEDAVSINLLRAARFMCVNQCSCMLPHLAAG